MLKYFLKMFGICMFILALIGIIVGACIIAINIANPIVGCIVMAVAISIFVAAICTIAEYNWRKIF